MIRAIALIVLPVWLAIALVRPDWFQPVYPVLMVATGLAGWDWTRRRPELSQWHRLLASVIAAALVWLPLTAYMAWAVYVNARPTWADFIHFFDGAQPMSLVVLAIGTFWVMCYGLIPVWLGVEAGAWLRRHRTKGPQ